MLTCADKQDKRSERHKDEKHSHQTQNREKYEHILCIMQVICVRAKDFELLIQVVLYADVSLFLIVLFCPADVTVDLPCRCRLQVALLRPPLPEDRRVQVRTSPLGGIEIQYQMGGAASLSLAQRLSVDTASTAFYC